METTPPLLEIHAIDVNFHKRGQVIHAVRGVSFDVKRGTTVGIVGESGSGKSTLARSIMQLVPLASGQICFEGIDLAQVSKKQMKKHRRQMQMVFQDPGGSLNEYMRVGNIITEPLLVHGLSRGSEWKERAIMLLEQVGLCADDAKKYPHEFSGGQKQRIAIARAIALEPKFLVCDEPTSALDVSVQAKVLNLLSDLREKLNLTILFVSHDLAVIHHFCNEVAVMSHGEIIEKGEVEQVIHSPEENMTKELIASSQLLNFSNSPSFIE